MFHWIKMIIVGIIVGYVASFVYNRFGNAHLGHWYVAAAVGVLGSFVFGLIGKAFHPESSEGVHPAGFLYSVIGSIALIFLGHNVLHLL
jgi:uncharacterized membrane protein YeaQ/YmgE (transglycosylase-associated protein family)